MATKTSKQTASSVPKKSSANPPKAAKPAVTITKPKAAASPKPQLNHHAMIIEAIKALQDKTGSTIAAIKKYVLHKYNLTAEYEKKIVFYIKKALASRQIVAVKGGTYKLAEVAQPAPTNMVAKKPAAKKPTGVKAKAPAPKAVKAPAKPAAKAVKAKAVAKPLAVKKTTATKRVAPKKAVTKKSTVGKKASAAPVAAKPASKPIVKKSLVKKAVTKKVAAKKSASKK